MAPPPTVTSVIGICVAGLLLLAVAEAAATKTKSSDDNFANTVVKEDGEERVVADPIGDPHESDTIAEDVRAAWQADMMHGLYAQRRAENDLIKKLKSGGEGLMPMLNKIKVGFKELEDDRKQKGFELIKAHFENEIQLLEQSSKKILSSLKSLLTGQSSDSSAIKSLKAKVIAVLKKGFSEQLKDESDLFKKQMRQIQEEHTRQNTNVQKLFALLKGWKESFETGLKKSEEKLESIAEGWDLL